MKNLLYIAFISCFLFMSINGILFFIAEQSTDNLIGFFVFAAGALILIFISEKKYVNYKSFSTLSLKILLATIGGLAIPVIVLFDIDLNRLEFFIAIGLAFFVYSLFEKRKEFFLIEGPFLLFLGIVLFILSLSIANIYDKDFIDLIKNYNTPYFLRHIARMSVMLGVMGLCQSIVILITVITNKTRV